MIQQNFDMEVDDFNFSTHFSPYLEEKPEPEPDPEPEPKARSRAIYLELFYFIHSIVSFAVINTRASWTIKKSSS